ncbi:hypothetical protein CAXC1_150008 [Candidatus Xenohaliotis californiensis]|uniref:Uncharacterized protein n=1 Tax=Candidatus Xenohaliotis californiensis TaxID=84677 RepID=A0ABP0EUX8_9RICK|nr:hypothetical protein CAXC1_150008 [Candidatus Xenohaliotis californiensis]
MVYYLDELKDYLVKEFETKLNLRTINMPLGTKKNLMPYATINTGKITLWQYVIGGIGMKHALFINFFDNVVNFESFKALVFGAVDVLLSLDNMLAMEIGNPLISHEIKKVDFVSCSTDTLADSGLVRGSIAADIFAFRKNCVENMLDMAGNEN